MSSIIIFFITFFLGHQLTNVFGDVTHGPSEQICLINSETCDHSSAGDNIPDPYDCTKYYVCAGSPLITGLSINCPTGEYFDEVTRLCISDGGEVCLPLCGPPKGYCKTECDAADFSQVATNNCGEYKVCAASPILQYCTEDEPYFDGDTCQANPDNCCKSCVAFCTEGEIRSIADPYDCRKFYLCRERGFPYENGTCKDTEFYDKDAQDCLTGSCENFCTHTIVTTVQSTVQSTAQSTVQSTVPTTITTYIPETTAVIYDKCVINSASCSMSAQNDKIPEPYDCTKYWVCSGDPLTTIGPFDCPTGQYFDASESECIPGDGTCIPVCGSPKGYCQTECLVPDLSLAATTNCSEYLLCSASTTLHECPVETPYFDGKTCQNYTENCCEECMVYCSEEDGANNRKIRDPCNCEGYYYCEGKGYPTTSGTCESTKYWDSIESACEVGPCENFCNCTSSIYSTMPTTAIFS